MFPHPSAVQITTSARLTSEFEKGSGGATPLWPSDVQKRRFVFKGFVLLIYQFCCFCSFEPLILYVILTLEAYIQKVFDMLFLKYL